MERKFKQISHQGNSFSVPIRNSQPAVNDAINQLLGKVSDHVYHKTALQKSKTYLNGKITNLEIDSVKQVYQPQPALPHEITEQISPRKGVSDSLRPMSAQIHHLNKTNQRISINNNSDSKKTIASHSSFSRQLRTKRNTVSMRSVMEINSRGSKKNYQKKNYQNQKRFFAVKNQFQEDDLNMDFIEQLRMKKRQQENEMKKKQQFLKSIQLQSTSYSTAQAKFIQSINRKKFIYGQQGEIIEINGTQQKQHLKKISAMSKSRIEIKSKTTDLKTFQDELKENIYIQFKGRETYQSRPETCKPHLNTEKSQQTNKENANRLFSAKEVKRCGEDGLIGKANKQIGDQTKVHQTPRNKETRGSTQTDKGVVKKKIEKILFYPSPNSVYRVVNEASPSQSNNGLAIEEI